MSDRLQTLALCLSGGGFRATFFHLGVIRFLRDAGLLNQVAVLCSVSGGSILAGHLAHRWGDYLGDDASFQKAANELASFGQLDVRGRIVRRVPLGALLRRFRRTSLLKYYCSRLVSDTTLGALSPDPSRQNHLPEFHFLTTSMTSGNLCFFSADGFHVDDGSKVKHFPRGFLSLSTAMAASAAFPPLFPPLKLSRNDLDASVQDFPYDCEYLTDGGVFDNLGIRHLLRSSTNFSSVKRVLISDASGAFDWDTARTFSLIVSRTVRATDILMKRVADLEEEHIRWESKSGQRRFLNAFIGDVVHKRDYPHALDPDVQRKLRKLRTDFDRFHREEIRGLISHGYAVAYKAFATLNREQPAEAVSLPDTAAPPWNPFPGHQSGQPRSVADRIEKGRKRRWNLWNANDPMSWVLFAFMLLVLLGPSVSVYLLREDLRRERLAVEAERENVNALVEQLYVTVPLKVATTRAVDNPLGPAVGQFGSNRGEMTFAFADISIPSAHRMGSLESPSIWSLYKQDPETQVVVRGLSMTTRRDMLTTANLPDGTPQPLLIFVHGWNINFIDSVRQAAVTAYDLAFSGTTLLFSWPSAGIATRYAVDANNAEWSVLHFRNILTDLLNATDKREINIIATDLGGRIAVGAIGGALRNSGPIIKRLILVAPDIDVKVFSELSNTIARNVQTTTIYADPNSRALKLAQSFVNSPRLGSGAVPENLFENIHLIAVREDSNALGHSYYGQATSALSDVFQVLEDKQPSERFGLERTTYGWVLRH